MATQTGTGKARDKSVLRSRLAEFYDETPIWWPEDTDFNVPTPTSAPTAPAAFLRPQQGATFGERGTVAGNESRNGSWSLIAGVQVRPGVDSKMAAIESQVRAVADVLRNDDLEDVWSPGHVETHEDVAPGGIPSNIQDAFRFDQFVIPYFATEIGR